MTDDERFRLASQADHRAYWAGFKGEPMPEYPDPEVLPHAAPLLRYAYALGQLKGKESQ